MEPIRESEIAEKEEDSRRQYQRVCRAHMSVELRREEEAAMARLMALAGMDPAAANGTGGTVV